MLQLLGPGLRALGPSFQPQSCAEALPSPMQDRVLQLTGQPYNAAQPPGQPLMEQLRAAEARHLDTKKVLASASSELDAAQFKVRAGLGVGPRLRGLVPVNP